MSYPDINDVSTAYTLCTCTDHGCSRQCTVCWSPTWVGHPCLKQVWRQLSDDAMRAMLSKVAAGNLGAVEPEKPALDELVEQCIDFMEERGIPLLPWQAEAFRAIMLRQDTHMQVRWGR